VNYNRSLWAISESILPDLESLLRRARENPEIVKQAASNRQAPRGAQRGGDIVSLPLFGMIDAHPSWLLDFMGGTSSIEFGQAFDRVMAMPSVSTIVLEVNSPGGSIAGTPELADKIYNARGRGKQIVAHVNTFAASAAYWIASQADRVIVTPSGDVGSIGVYILLRDLTGALDQAGVKTTIIRQPAGKIAANPYEALPDSARAEIQASVDATYNDFLKAVARGRGVSVARVAQDFGQGSMVDARDALRKGMVDSVQSFDGAIASILAGRSQTSLARAEHDLQKAEMELFQAKRNGAKPQAVKAIESFVEDCEENLVQARREFSRRWLHDPAVSPEVRRLRTEHEQRKRERLRYSRN
jgi:signal peptide peptidase SppA